MTILLQHSPTQWWQIGQDVDAGEFSNWMSHYALGTEIGKLGEASCQAGWWHQASWFVVFKDSCSYRSWSNFMFCAWGLLRDVTCMFIGGGTTDVTPREVCETGDRSTKGNPLLWPSWNREDPISMCCCQSNKCLLYSCHWQWGCPEVCWRRGSYGSLAVPGNVMLLSGWTSGGWADPKSLILCSTFRFQVMPASCPVAPCLAPQEIPVSIYCLTNQWIFYSCAVLSCSLFTICPWVQTAWSKKACIVFFDEVDAIGGAQFDDGSGGGNEVQHTMLEIVNQLDGFDARGNIKVLMATNRYRFRH